MQRNLLAAIASVAIMLVGGRSEAVDVVNEDHEGRQLQVNIDGDEILVFVPAGQALTGVCERCSLSLDGEDSVDAIGDQIAIISNGKLTVR